MKIKNYKLKNLNNKGFSILEVILAAAIFMLFAIASGGAILQGFTLNRLGVEETVATQFATEGLEAARSIRNQNYSNLTNTLATGVARNATSGTWEFSGSNNILNAGKTYTRTIKVENVQRNPCNIVTTGGALDPDTKKITSSVSWNFTPSRSNSVDLITYLSNWKKPITPTSHGGLLLYGDGGTTSDSIKYRILDGPTGTWGPVIPLPDFDTSTSNKALRAVRMDASITRNEKIALSRHVANGSAQSIWAHVFNGTTWISTQLSAFSSSSNLDARNFDGTYLNNGNFMAVYSDNTSTPKYRIWDGCQWSTQSSLINLANNGSGIPIYIVAKNRPGTNEAMTAFFGVGRDTNTQYYNGTLWTLHPRHSSSGPADKEMIDFVWSPNNNTKGSLIYPSGSSDRSITSKIWTADGSGGGAWSIAANASNQSVLGAMTIDGRFGADEFLACSKDTSNDIYCFRETSTPSFTTPTNNILTTGTDSGIQRSYDFAFESASGTNGLVVYSNNSSTPQRRIYTPGVSSSFSAPLNLTTALLGNLKTVKEKASKETDDIMILMGDANNDLYTIVWDGANNNVYSSPLGKAKTTHGTNGSATTDFWYDFAWDKN